MRPASPRRRSGRPPAAERGPSLPDRGPPSASSSSVVRSSSSSILRRLFVDVLLSECSLALVGNGTLHPRALAPSPPVCWVLAWFRCAALLRYSPLPRAGSRQANFPLCLNLRCPARHAFCAWRRRRRRRATADQHHAVGARAPLYSSTGSNQSIRHGARLARNRRRRRRRWSSGGCS